MLSDLGATPPARVLLVGDDPRAATMLVEMLRDAWPTGLLVTQTGDIGDATHELADHGDSCVLLDLSGAGEDLGPLRALVAAAPDAAIVVISDRDDERLGVAAVNAGAQDHLLRTELHPTLLTRALRYALERKRAEVRLTRQALEDPLTGLPNRALFLDRVGVALDRSQRTGLAPAVMFLDVDSFKAVNDSRGHAAGDRLLCTLSERFQALLRPMDTVARLGGDEFTFLFEGLSGRDEACAIARRVNVAASEPLRLGPDEMSVGVSIGVAMLDDPRAAPEDALSDADTAMYRAKSLGGGRAELFDAPVAAAEPTAAAPEPTVAAPEPTVAAPEPTVAAPATIEPEPEPVPVPTRRTALSAVADPDPSHPPVADALDADALRDGLADGQLRLHYQPRVSIDGRTGLVGFEALVRWEHPQRGLIVPAEFMDLAEDSGLIVEIGDWVLGEALSQVRRWRQSRPGMTISVNLSPAQLADPSLVDRLAQRLRVQHTDPSVLWLEISEAALLHDRDHTATVIGELAELGVGMAIDDFGRGPAGAEQLQSLPVEMLKIDRSVISHLNGGGPQSELVGAVVALGHELGLSVVAEGVETDHQLASVRDLGCDGAQGYLFSRPVPEESVRELLGAG